MNQASNRNTAAEGDERIGDDLLVGAEAIARELNWRNPDGSWNRRRVYHVAEKKHGMPIYIVPGLGLCSRKSALKAYFAALERKLASQGELFPD